MTATGKKLEFDILITYSKKQQFLLEQVIKDLQDQLDYSVAYPVKIGRFEVDDLMATIDKVDKCIILNDRLFDRGKRDIAMNIMEQQEILTSELIQDKRSFNEQIFSKWLASLEDAKGFFF